MKSGLEGRNKGLPPPTALRLALVSMKSGLEGRNKNQARQDSGTYGIVSMKSGLEGRNNIDEDSIPQVGARSQ